MILLKQQVKRFGSDADTASSLLVYEQTLMQVGCSIKGPPCGEEGWTMMTEEGDLHQFVFASQS